MNLPSTKIVKDELISIIQDPEVKVLGHGKTLQINVQIVGDSAIEKAIKWDGTTRAAMQHLLESLPEPKLKWLRTLAIDVVREGRTAREAAKLLGLTERSIFYGTEKYTEFPKET